MAQNSELLLTLDDAVAEVLGLLTGLDLQYEPEQDRYQAIVRQLNRALRANALEKEWSWYADGYYSIATVSAGEIEYTLPSSRRFRIIGDDSARIVRPEDDHPVIFAPFLPRDALAKYIDRRGLWCAVTRNTIRFNMPLWDELDGYDIQVPVMREPIMFRPPQQSENPDDLRVMVPDEIRNQEIDFQYPDLITLRAAMYYAATDPVMQPRVQTLEAQYKDLMYQVIERDDRNTDAPLLNDIILPMESSIYGGGHPGGYPHHPHASEV